MGLIISADGGIISCRELGIYKMSKSGTKKTRVIKATVITIGVIVVLYVALSIFGAVAAIEIPRRPLEDSPASVGLDYEEVAFHSRGDGILLRGWFIPAESELVIIIVHGGYENRVDKVVDTLNLAHDLMGKGYNLLLFDLRGRGESAGKGRTLSNIQLDIGGAVDYLKNRGYTTDRIAMVGYCSGAASVCIFASQEKVGALVLDGCFPNVQIMMARQAAQRNIPLFLLDFFWPGVFQAGRTIYGFKLVNPIDIVAGIDCPILFIHEEYDDIITLEDNFQLLKASNNSANEVWQINGAEHSEAYTKNTAAYVNKLHTFLSTRMEIVQHLP